MATTQNDHRCHAIAEQLATFLRGTADLSQHFPTVILARERIHLFVRDSWREPEKITVSVHPDDGGTIHNAPRGNFSTCRPILHVARDIRRRLIEPARFLLLAHYQARSAEATAEQAVRLKKAEAAEALGAESTSHYGAAFVCRGVTIKEDYYIDRTDGHFPGTSAQIHVKHWPAFLQICRILKADHETPL